MGTETALYGPNRGPDARIAELAAAQHGVVAAVQLRAAGLTVKEVRRRSESGRLHRLHRGVYAVGHTRLTYYGHLIAAVLACGPAALASHRAAGRLHGFVASEAIEVSAPRGCKPKPGIRVHRPRELPSGIEIDAIPVTTAARTLVDLAGVLSAERLAKAVARADELRAFDLQAVERELGERRGSALRGLLADYRPEPHLLRSEAERRLKRLIRTAGLPMPQFNVQLHGHEVDAYWPRQRLVLEVDGARAHGTRRAFHQDRRRDRSLTAAGERVVRVTVPDLEPALADELRAILRRR